MNIREIKAKTVVCKSGLPKTDYVINPYVGCAHACVYCYARFMKRFTNHEEPWGEFVDVKINAGQLVQKELGKIRGKRIFLASVTDPYQPLEKKYQLTRTVLKEITKTETTVSILTKSDLVRRDLDLLEKIKQVEVGISFSGLNEEVRKIFEPRTSSVEQKIKALEEVKKAGIKTYAFLGPILPGITDLEELFKTFKQVKVDLVMAENLNTKGSLFTSLLKAVRAYNPNLIKLYAQVKKEPEKYWEPVKEQVSQLAKKYELPTEVYFDH